MPQQQDLRFGDVGMETHTHFIPIPLNAKTAFSIFDILKFILRLSVR